MLIRDIVGTTLAGLAAAALALAPGLFQAPAPSGPGSAAMAGGPSGARAPVEAASTLVHPCPETTQSECRAVFLPPLADNDNDGAAHTAHQPQVRICGPLDEGVSIQGVSSCDDTGTGEEVEFFPFGCGDMSDCVEVAGEHFQANWHIPADDECEGDDDDDDGDEDEDCEEDDDDDDEEDDEDEDEDEEDDEADDGDAIESGFYLIEARLNGNPAGGVVIEVGGTADDGEGEEDDDDGDDDDGDDDDDADEDDDEDGGGECGPGSGAAPFFCPGETVPIRFRLHDKIVG